MDSSNLGAKAKITSTAATTLPSFSSLFGGVVKNSTSSSASSSSSSSSSLSLSSKTINQQSIGPPSLPFPRPPPSPPKATAASTKPNPIATTSEGIEEFSGLSIKDRCVPLRQVREALTGRTVYKISDFESGDQRKFATPGGDSKKHVSWATVGVLTEKSFPKSSHGGGSEGRPGSGNYQIWTLSDFRAQISLFVFAEAYAGLANEPLGSIFLISSPSLVPAVERRSFSLSASKDGQVVRIGTSPDFGTCRGTRKDGKPCTMVINATKCQYCKFHVQDVYRKAMQAQGVFTMSTSGAIINGTGGRNISQGRYSGRSAEHISSLAEKSNNFLQGVTSLGPKKGVDSSVVRSLHVGKDGLVTAFSNLPFDEIKKAQTVATTNNKGLFSDKHFLTDEKARLSITTSISNMNANTDGGRSSRFGIRQVGALLGPCKETSGAIVIPSLPVKRKREESSIEIPPGFGTDEELSETLRFSAIKSAASVSSKKDIRMKDTVNSDFINLSDSEEDEGNEVDISPPKTEIKTSRTELSPQSSHINVKQAAPTVNTVLQLPVRASQHRAPPAKSLNLTTSLAPHNNKSHEEVERLKRLQTTETFKEKLKLSREGGLVPSSRQVLSAQSSVIIPKKVQTLASVSAALKDAETLINKSSTHADEGADAALSHVLCRMDDRARIEAMQDVLAQKTSKRVTRFICVDCERAFDKRPVMCFSQNHVVHTKEKTVWAFKCRDCNHHLLYDFSVCTSPCPKCGVGVTWEASGVERFKEKSNDSGLMSKLQPRGEEQINSLRYG
jgi:hypothetical protein